MQIIKNIFLLLLFGISSNLWSQNGYKNFSWGMSEGAVRNEVQSQLKMSEFGQKYPDANGWEKNYTNVFPSTDFIAITEFRNPKIDWWPQDLSSFRGNWDGEGSGIFTFSNNKLVSVTLWWNFKSSALQDLINIRGQGRIIRIMSSGKEILTRVWQNGDRYIVWCQGESIGIAETVSYIDANWINSIIDERYKKALQYQQEQREKNRKLLD